MYTHLADTQRKNYVIMTSKRLRFDVVMTLSLRRVLVGQKRIDVRVLKKQFDHSGTEIEIFQDENFIPIWFLASITRSSLADTLYMLDKPLSMGICIPVFHEKNSHYLCHISLVR